MAVNSPRQWQRLVTLSLSLALIFGLAYPAAARQSANSFGQSETAFEEDDCLWDLPTSFTEGEDITCGWVTVPLFHDEPNGDTIRLAVGIIHGTGNSVSDTPTVMLNGGPGGSSATTISLFEDNPNFTLAPVRDGRDVVVFDQRGTGFSEPALFCPGDLPPGQDELFGDVSIDEMANMDPEEFAQLCADRVAEMTDLRAYNTIEIAQDINDVITALDYEQVDLWGQSYGTRVALEAMRQLPEDAIRSVVLESVLPPQADFLKGPYVAFDAALRELADQCEADSACSVLAPDLLDQLTMVVEDLNAEPYETSYTDLITDEDVEATVDGATFLYVVYQSVFSGILLPVVPLLIAETATGGTTVLDTLLPIMLASPDVASGMYFAVSCQDELPFSSLEQTEATAEAAGVLDVITENGVGIPLSDYYDACAAFDLPASDDIANEPVESDLPTLLVSGFFDPITPPAYAEAAAETLPNSFQVVAPNLAHTPITFSGCLLDVTLEFLADPASEPDTACVDDMQLQFATQ